MSAKYIFRLDDICENMNWDNYFRVKETFIDNNIQPIIGVIPNNQDKSLLKFPKCSFDFWVEIYRLQNDYGWSIALHGHTHVYGSNNSGVLKINNKSEFVGLSKERQNEKIKEGINILNKKGVVIDAFMAPAHSFDKVTIECLKANGIDTITDGYSLYPYYEDHMLFVPQLFAKPRRMPFGIYTWCLHTNSMSDKRISELESFIKDEKCNIIGFSQARNYIIGSINYKFQGLILKNLVTLVRNLKS